MAGRYFEDFRLGDVYRHPLGRTVTQVDNIWFSLLTMNTNPLHFDSHFAEGTTFGRPLVNSCLTLSIVTGISVTDVSQHAVANLGWNDVRLTHPVFEGDTIYAESTVIEVRASQSHPEAGIVRVRTRGYTQEQAEVIAFERTILVHRREAAAPGPARRE